MSAPSHALLHLLQHPRLLEYPFFQVIFRKLYSVPLEELLHPLFVFIAAYFPQYLPTHKPILLSIVLDEHLYLLVQ